MPVPPEPVLPDYGGACIDSVVAVLRERRDVAWLPGGAGLAAARQIVFLTLDGLGWEQLQERAGLAPTLTAMAGGPVTSVAPTTTATALTSITTGLTRPAPTSRPAGMNASRPSSTVWAS